MARVTEFEEALMHRDGITREEARKARKEAIDDISELIEMGDYEGVEDLLAGDYGLEMDYIFDLI